MKPLIVTSGDPAGIGPEIVIKAVNAWRSLGEAQRPLLVSGDPEWFETLGKKLSITTKNVSFIPISWDKNGYKIRSGGEKLWSGGFRVDPGGRKPLYA
jgi:4-hydroxy-L-threonine phosphate dehydrogenase PdxA